MGKYIIRLERGETAYKTVNSNGKPMIQLLAPIPYTEPDLEQVKKEAYERGAEDMRKALRLLIDCDDDCLTIPDIFKAFREGSYHAVVRKHPAMEIIEKILQYERGKEEIQVGDEVAFHHDDGRPDTVVVVTYIGQDGYIDGMDGRGTQYAHKNPKKWTKTGRHFPEITEVLQKMKEGE